jgi:hypothetical protein
MAVDQHDDRRKAMSTDERPTYTGPTTRAGLQALIWGMRADLEALVAEAGPGRLAQPGAMGDWSLRDCIAHLTAWRWWSVTRLEAVPGGATPTPPWTGDHDEGTSAGADAINEQFQAAARGQSDAAVLRDSRATLDRMEAALLAVPEGILFAPGHFPWLHGYPIAAIITGSAEHLAEHRGPALAALRGGA